MNDDQTVQLKDLKGKALGLMASAGYPLQGDVEVVIDKTLPYMGYTTERNNEKVIVVSGEALSGSMALNLLIHEMSHQYHIQTGHPSHNQQLLLTITAWVMHGKAVEPYQEEILQSILNNIQDLYADDISFKIFEKHERLNEFFMGWIHTPVAVRTLQDRWENAENLVNAAFAQANLERHDVHDTDGKLQKAVAAFLAKCDKRIAEKYTFFKDFMVLMPEQVKEKEFEKMLILYLSEFLKLTK